MLESGHIAPVSPREQFDCLPVATKPFPVELVEQYSVKPEWIMDTPEKEKDWFICQLKRNWNGSDVEVTV
jgi:hypothetical protein